MLTLDLKNFRRFVETEPPVAFPEGITIVTGPNGAGKSTLIEAVAHALFGPKRGPGAGGFESDNAIDPTEVACRLHIDGQEVYIRRVGGVAELYVDGALQIPGNVGSANLVTKQVAILLGGLTREQFMQVYVAEQGATAGLVAENSKTRRDVIDVALQVDVLRAAAEAQGIERTQAIADLTAQGRIVVAALGLDEDGEGAVRKLRDARTPTRRKAELDRLSGRSDAGLRQLEEAVRQAQQEAGRIQAELAVLTTDVDAKKLHMEELEQEIKEHDERHARQQSFVGLIAGHEAIRDQAERDIATKTAAISRAETYADAARKHADIQQRLDKANARVARLPAVKARWEALANATAAISNLEERLRQLGDPEADLVGLRATEDTARSHWESLETDPTAEALGEWNRRTGSLEDRRRQAEAGLEALATASTAECPACGQPLNEHARAAQMAHLRQWLENDLPAELQALSETKAAIDSQRQQWVADRKKAQTEWEHAKSAVGLAETRLQQLKSLRLDLEVAQDNVHRTETAWRELEEPQGWRKEELEELEDLREELAPQLEELRDAAQEYASLPRLRDERTEAEKRCRDAGAEARRLKEEQSAVGYDAEAHARAKNDLQGTRAAHDEVARTASAKDKDFGAANARVESARGAAARGQQAWDNFSSIAAGYRQTERLHGFLDGFYKYFFVRNTAEVADRATSLIAEVVTDGTILGVQFNESGDLFYLDGSNARKPVSRLSGGEKALVGLCVRLALAEQALRIAPTGRLEFLFLDEVLSSLDDDRRQAVRQVLDIVQSRGVFKHVVMVTHLESVKQEWAGARLDVRKVDAKTSRVVAGELDATSYLQADGEVLDLEEVNA